MESTLNHADFDSYEEYLDYIEVESEIAEEEIEPEIG